MAIKLLPPDLTRDETAKQRFLQEAQAASALDHPNICTIHEINETDDGQLYLACEDFGVRCWPSRASGDARSFRPHGTRDLAGGGLSVRTWEN